MPDLDTIFVSVLSRMKFIGSTELAELAVALNVAPHDVVVLYFDLMIKGACMPPMVVDDKILQLAGFGDGSDI